MGQQGLSLRDKWCVIRRNQRRFEPEGKVEVGRASERVLAATLERQFKAPGHEYWLGLRVPDGGRRHEIDAVMALPDELWAVELKYWSGEVRLEGKEVVQYRPGGRGRVEHGRLLTRLRHREEALERYLRQYVEEVPLIWTVLVFAGDHVQLDPALRGAEGLDVVRWPEFVAALPQTGASGEASGKVIDATRALDRLGTWDLLWLNGGRIISGDIRGGWPEKIVDRSRYRRLRLKAPRRLWDVFRSQMVLEVEADGRQGDEEEAWTMGMEEGWIEFKGAGEGQARRYELRDIRGVVFGSSRQG